MIEAEPRLFRSSPERSIKVAQRRARPAKTPFGRWLEGFCQGEMISMGYFLDELEIRANAGQRDSFGRSTMMTICQKAPQVFGLTREQQIVLEIVVGKTIVDKERRGHRFQENNGAHLKAVQKTLPGTTFNGQQAAEMFGVSRGRIWQLRQELGLPVLMTEKNVAELGERLEKTKALRETWLRSIMKSRAGSAGN